MDITIYQIFLPHEDPGASLGFYRDVFGFQIRGDDGSGTMRKITVGFTDQPDTASASPCRDCDTCLPY